MDSNVQLQNLHAEVIGSHSSDSLLRPLSLEEIAAVAGSPVVQNQTP